MKGDCLGWTPGEEIARGLPHETEMDGDALPARRIAGLCGLPIGARANAGAGAIGGRLDQGRRWQLYAQPSGAVCATSVQGFALKGLDLSATEGSLGICNYADGAGRVAQIRVRHYLPGVGETALAIENDKKLMESSADPKSSSAIRAGPGPAIDGQTSLRDVITVRRNDLLIDCAAWEKMSQSDGTSPIMDFAIGCLHMPGE
jgi:hypothetical protein